MVEKTDNKQVVKKVSLSHYSFGKCYEGTMNVLGKIIADFALLKFAI